MPITISEGGKKVLELKDLTELKALTQVPKSVDKSNFKVRHKIKDALKEAETENIKQDAALVLKIIRHMKKQGYEVDEDV